MADQSPASLQYPAGPSNSPSSRRAQLAPSPYASSCLLLSGELSASADSPALPATMSGPERAGAAGQCRGPLRRLGPALRPTGSSAADYTPRTGPATSHKVVPVRRPTAG